LAWVAVAIATVIGAAPAEAAAERPPRAPPSAQPMLLTGRATVRLRGRALRATVDAHYDHVVPDPMLPPPARYRFATRAPGGRVHGTLNATIGAGARRPFARRVRGRFDALLVDPGGAARALGRPRAPSALRIHGAFDERGLDRGVLRVHARRIAAPPAPRVVAPRAAPTTVR
jgi:hypothetical protein